MKQIPLQIQKNSKMYMINRIMKLIGGRILMLIHQQLLLWSIEIEITCYTYDILIINKMNGILSQQSLRYYGSKNQFGLIKLEQILKYKIFSYQESFYQNYNQFLKDQVNKEFQVFLRVRNWNGLLNNKFLVEIFLFQMYFKKQKFIQILYASLVGMVIDVFINQLILIQSKMIYQNRLPNQELIYIKS
ncbi:unnamed protein product [Paramecium pentaurelia]|uniref:Transmembrane protein n=1 Tax=Paramecium pentaurelia TaxID=43138 RepID=A0A8S1T2E7_9CILI|nr:unnamed protein product [Paramecium pentaurelia]